MDQVHDAELVAGEPDTKLRFLYAIDSRARLPRHVTPAAAASVVMCTLALRLTSGQVYRLLAAIPEPLQPLFQRCLAHRYGPVEPLDDAHFLERIARRLGLSPAHAELVCDCVFRGIRTLIPSDVIEHVAIQLPRDLSDLWLGRRTPVEEVPAAREPAGREQLFAEIAERAPLPPWISAPDAFSIVMCIFSQRLSGGEARDVFLGLPETLRLLIDRCVFHRDEEAAVFDREQFLRSVEAELGTTRPETEQVVQVVLAAAKRLLPTKEVHDITSQLPVDLREIWELA